MNGVMNMDMEYPQLLRLDEVTRLCGVSKSFVYREMAAGRFPRPLRVGRRAARWKLSEILAWIESRPLASQETWQ